MQGRTHTVRGTGSAQNPGVHAEVLAKTSITEAELARGVSHLQGIPQQGSCIRSLALRVQTGVRRAPVGMALRMLGEASGGGDIAHHGTLTKGMSPGKPV